MWYVLLTLSSLNFMTEYIHRLGFPTSTHEINNFSGSKVVCEDFMYTIDLVRDSHILEVMYQLEVTFYNLGAGSLSTITLQRAPELERRRPDSNKGSMLMDLCYQRGMSRGRIYVQIHSVSPFPFYLLS